MRNERIDARIDDETNDIRSALNQCWATNPWVFPKDERKIPKKKLFVSMKRIDGLWYQHRGQNNSTTYLWMGKSEEAKSSNEFDDGTLSLLLFLILMYFCYLPRENRAFVNDIIHYTKCRCQIEEANEEKNRNRKFKLEKVVTLWCNRIQTESRQTKYTEIDQSPTSKQWMERIRAAIKRKSKRKRWSSYERNDVSTIKLNEHDQTGFYFVL